MHRCPNGTSTRLNRDAAAPVGVLARMTCPACGWTMDGPALMAAVERVLNATAVRARLAAAR